MDSSTLVDTINFCTYLGVPGYNIKKNDVFVFLKIYYILTHSVDPGEMPQHLGLQCL